MAPVRLTPPSITFPIKFTLDIRKTGPAVLLNNMALEDRRGLKTFEHSRCPRSIARELWLNFANSAEVKPRVLAFGTQSIEQGQNSNRSGYVLRIPTNRLPRYMLLLKASSRLKTRRSGQSLTRKKSMRSSSGELSRTGRVSLLSWSSQDPPIQRLEILGDEAKYCSDWFFFHSKYLCFSIVFFCFIFLQFGAERW